MTTVCMSNRNCFVCGATGRFPHSQLTAAGVGLRDLDGRPTHILRSSVYLWIQRCLSCGYCAPEISEGEHADTDVLHTDEYRTQLDNPAFPETANSFMCHSLVMRHRGLPADAAWAAVFAAWICDDNKYPESAMCCRREAIDLFITAREQSVEFADSRALEDLYLVDLYRRCGDFTMALDRCTGAIECKPADEMLDLFYFEKDLIEQGDSGIHTVADIDEMV